MSASHDDQPVEPRSKSEVIQDRLKLFFAILSCLGGLVLASGEGTELIPVVAIFFAVFGFVFVDWLKLFALPPIAAYILMGIAAVYCVADFWDLDAPGNQQMLSVAQLLVFVQAILMLQEKTPRIFEQLAVFCLLELVVAAVFNDAPVYGMLLLPIGIIGVLALALLSSVTSSEGLTGAAAASFVGKSQTRAGSTSTPRTAAFRFAGIRFSAGEAARSLASGTSRMSRFVLLTLAPAILLVGAIFFYAIPRTTDAARIDGRGNALVGFDDQIRLEQIGSMLKSTEPALRVKLSDRGSGRPYHVVGGIYLRGQVLEQYEPQYDHRRSTATWASVFAGATGSRVPLPPEFIPARTSDTNFFDSVAAEITCEPMRSPALFTIAPYFQIKFDENVGHSDGRWTLSRREEKAFFYPRLKYQFGTNAFRDGVQSDMIAAPQRRRRTFSLREPFSIGDQLILRRQIGIAQGSYLERVLQFDQRTMPTVARLATDIRGSIPEPLRTDLKVARAMERHLALAGGYEYTLDLNADSVPGMDPIEQFMSVDRRGHCQYFASALAMMLRSVEIPARVVVGYRTNNFNEIGQYYLARQSDAHAWVEALISRNRLDGDRVVYGQPMSRQYWVRLDPTPGGGGVQQGGGGGVEQVINLARNIWEEYVVDMDADRQNRALAGNDDESMGGPYTSMVGWFQQKIAAIRAGGLGGGSLAIRDVFSWQAAIIASILAITLFLLLRIRWPRLLRRQFKRNRTLFADNPTIPFYAETLNQMARLGMNRRPAETPREFLAWAGQQLHATGDNAITESLATLTDQFCRQRYGVEESDVAQSHQVISKLKNQVDLLIASPDFALRRAHTESPSHQATSPEQTN